MTQVITNDVSAVQPELWSAMVQVPLYKSLVAMEVANMRLSDTAKYADTVHIPRFGSLSVATYTPGTSITATAQDKNAQSCATCVIRNKSFLNIVKLLDDLILSPYYAMMTVYDK